MADPSTEAAPEKAPPTAPPLLAVGGLGTMDSILRDVSTRLQPEMDRRKEQSERFATSMEESAKRTSALSAEVAGSFAEKGRIQDQYAAEIARLQPDKPPEFHETEPLKAFGSYATVLGVLGGLFTRQPLMASLNAASAAMGSIRKRDFESFDYHMKEWRAQSDHAINLLNWQRTRYDAILQKYADKPQEALIQMQIQASADGNRQMAEAARSGYFDQVVKMKTDMFNMADKLQSSKNSIQNTWETHRANKAREDETLLRDQPEHIFEAAKKEYADAHDGKAMPAEEQADFWKRLKTSGVGSAVTVLQAEAINKRIAEATEKNGGKPISGEEEARIISDVKKGGLTGNQADQLDSRIAQIDYSLQTFDQIEAVLDKHIGAAGLAGKLLRPKEAFTNVFGSDETDRAQFARWVNYLQGVAGRLLTDSHGRPLSSEADHMQSVIAGLNMGDTTANTIRAYNELKTLFQKMREDTVARRSGTFDPSKGYGAGGRPADKTEQLKEDRYKGMMQDAEPDE